MSPLVFQLCTQLWHSNITIPLCSYLTSEKVFKILLKGKETPLCILMCPERIYRVAIKNQGFWNSVDLDFTPGLPTCWLCGSAVKNLPAHAEDVGLIPGFRTIAWRRKWQPTPIFFPGKSLGEKSLVGYSSWGCERVGHDLATEQQNFTPGLPTCRLCDSGQMFECLLASVTSVCKMGVIRSFS